MKIFQFTYTLRGMALVLVFSTCKSVQVANDFELFAG